jgi:hypothetical protein
MVAPLVIDFTPPLDEDPARFVKELRVPEQNGNK